MSSASRSERARSDPGDLALFHRTLAGLCRAEVPLPRALRLAGAEVGRGPTAEAGEALAAAVEGGEPFAAAYASMPGAFPALHRAVVEAGVAAGDLAAALAEVAQDATREADARRKIRQALLHPTLTAGAALLVGVAAVAIASPTLWDFASLVGESSPAPLALGALGALAALVAGFVLFAWRGSPFAAGRGTRVPILGPIRDARARAAFASALALLLRRRLPLPRALELSASCLPEPGLSDRGRAMAARAREGESLHEVLAAEKAFDPGLLWIAEGARGEDEAARALSDVAELLRRRFERGLDRFHVLARPVAEVAVGLVVLAFAYAYTVPLLRQANEVLNLWTS